MSTRDNKGAGSNGLAPTLRKEVKAMFAVFDKEKYPALTSLANYHLSILFPPNDLFAQ
jgi:hypothetical protein